VRALAASLDDPELSEADRLVAARLLVRYHGETGLSIVVNELEGQRLAGETSMWYQVTHHPVASWEEGPTEPKIIGGVLIVIGSAGTVCLKVDACAAYVDKLVAVARNPAAQTVAGQGSTAATRSTGAISQAQLSAAQASNYAGYVSKLPVKAEAATIYRLADGAVEFSARVPGNVPGSYAVYTKLVDAGGRTIGYWKETILPGGAIGSVKDKFL
jgi:hypothetical protein